MRFVLLTWNPGPNDDEQFTPMSWFDDMVIPLREGRRPGDESWSLGTNWRTVGVGDQVCLLRQGTHGRGIVATGVVIDGPYSDDHWKDDTRKAWYVDVAWNRALPINEMITIGELERVVPTFAWNRVYSSGRIVDGTSAERLGVLLGQGPIPSTDTGGGGQQFGVAEHNKLVELEAVKLVRGEYEQKGYKLKDVSCENLGWDLEGRRGSEVCYIEVKGTTGPIPEFFLTPNEYEKATHEKDWVAEVVTEAFGAVPKRHSFSGSVVVAGAHPTQYRVSLQGA